MEIFRIDIKKNNVLCRDCKQILKFNINHEKFEVEGICKNGHIFNNISFSSFINNFISSTTSITINCHKCFAKQENNIYLCQCQKPYCSKCIKSHLKEENHKIKKYKNIYHFCDIHKNVKSFFCDDCKIDICEKCKINHQYHYIKSILDIVPSQKLMESFPRNAEDLEEKILMLKERIEEKKKELDERFEKLKSFFDFIININEKLFQKYNFEINDFYNFENIYYINRYINNKKIIEEKTYLNYLLFNEKIDIGEQLIMQNKIDNNKITNKNFSLCSNYNNLKIFKDNLFFEIQIQVGKYAEKYIKIFELKEYLFKYIVNYDLYKFKKISSIKPANYGNYFLINLKDKKNIKFLEYDIKLKTLNLSEKEIKSNKFFNKYTDSHFLSFIDDQKGNILTVDLNELVVWKKNRNKKYFIELMSLAQKYYKLYHINEKFFFGEYSDLITFYNYDKYEIIQSIQYNGRIDSAYELNKNILILNEGNKYILISLKCFEIHQIIDFGQNIYFLKAKDNLLILYLIENQKIKIIKHIFNEKEGYFKEKKSKLLDTIVGNNPNVLVLNNNNIYIGDLKLLSIYSGVI